MEKEKALTNFELSMCGLVLIGALSLLVLTGCDLDDQQAKYDDRARAEAAKPKKCEIKQGDYIIQRVGSLDHLATYEIHNTFTHQTFFVIENTGAVELMTR